MHMNAVSSIVRNFLAISRKQFFTLLFLSCCGFCLASCDETFMQAQSKANEKGLSAEMQARIKSLKKEVLQTPTTTATLKERAQIVWAWANSLSLRGVTLPPMLPSDIAGMMTGNKTDEDGAEGGGPVSQALDAYIYELSLKENEPKALGSLSVHTDGPLRAGEYATLTQTYTVGEKPIHPGGLIVVAQHMFTLPSSRFQTDDPLADNYVSLTTSNPQVTLKKTSVTIAGTYGAFRSSKGQPAYEITGTALKPGEQIRIVYGDKSQGSRGHRLPKFSIDRYPLPIFVSFEAQKPAVFLPLVPVTVVGNKVASVSGFAPSIVGVGEKISLSVRSEDDNLNRATGPIPAYNLFLNGAPYKTIPASENAITLLENISFDKPGLYRLTLRSEDNAIEGDINPILVEENPQTRIYWGDTHTHSGMAEGQGSSAALFRYGYEDARLDFLVHSEHDVHLDDHEWEELRANTEKFYRPGEFITYLGYEWSVSVSDGGHHNVIFRTPEYRERVPLQTHPVLSRLYEGIRAKNDIRDVLIIPHAHNAGDWRQNDPGLESLIEISSLHGNFEWFGRFYLANGHQVGFVGASDDHFTHPGYSIPTDPSFGHLNGIGAVMAKEKTRDALFDAMKRGSTYATTSKRIILQARLNGGAMGTRVVFSPRRHIEGRVIGTTAIDEVAIVKNGKVVKSWDYVTDTSGQSRHFEIDFESQSVPIYESRDNPRHGRPWRGILRVSGARLISAEMPTAFNPSSEFVRAIEGEPNARRFATASRGNIKSISLELADITPQAKITLEIEEARELATTPLLYQTPQLLKAERAIFLVTDTAKGKTSFKIPRDDFYTDEIRLRRIKTAPASDQRFVFEENDVLRHGDYYYVRVRQQDGAQAYSSPFWVGGTSPK